MINTIAIRIVSLLVMTVFYSGCDRLGFDGAPSCGAEEVKRALIDAAMQTEGGPASTVFAWAANSLEADPEMRRTFRYRDPITGQQETTTGVQLAYALPALLPMLNMVSGMTSMFEGLSGLTDDPTAQARFVNGSRESERQVRAFTEDPNVKRVMGALERAIERGTAALRVTQPRPIRVDDKLRFCECIAQITWDDGTVLLDNVNYQAQFTTDGQLIVTFINHD